MSWPTASVARNSHPGMKYRQFDDVKLPVVLPGSFPAIM
jgi:hypothetical protein